jgi:hypothetical protein
MIGTIPARCGGIASWLMAGEPKGFTKKRGPDIFNLLSLLDLCESYLKFFLK